MSSPPYFPAHHPTLLHAYTFSRAGSFVQARVPWTRSAPFLFACCHDTLSPSPPYRSGIHTCMRSGIHTCMRSLDIHVPLGYPSIMHPTTTHDLSCQPSQMACSSWVVLTQKATPGCFSFASAHRFVRPTALQTTLTPHMSMHIVGRLVGAMICEAVIECNSGDGEGNGVWSCNTFCYCWQPFLEGVLE